MNITLEEVEKKLRWTEIEERQKYNYYCDCSNNWTTEQNEEYKKQWDEIIEKMHILKDLQNAMKKAEKYL